MVKNGLFLISFGMLVFLVWGVNGQTMRLKSVPIAVFSLILVVVGSVICYKGNKKSKEEQGKKE